MWSLLRNVGSEILYQKTMLEDLHSVDQIAGATIIMGEVCFEKRPHTSSSQNQHFFEKQPRVNDIYFKPIDGSAMFFKLTSL